MAQDIELILPNLVSKMNDTYSIDYSLFMGIAMKAIKEQQTQIDTMKATELAQQAQIDAMKATELAQQAQIDTMKALVDNLIYLNNLKK
jgi:hypothetical protein